VWLVVGLSPLVLAVTGVVCGSSGSTGAAAGRGHGRPRRHDRMTPDAPNR